jgi:hypothetical protein
MNQASRPNQNQGGSDTRLFSRLLGNRVAG